MICFNCEHESHLKSVCPSCGTPFDTAGNFSKPASSNNPSDSSSVGDSFFSQPANNNGAFDAPPPDNSRTLKRSSIISGIMGLILSGIGWVVLGAALGGAGFFLGISAIATAIKGRSIPGFLLGVAALLHSAVVLGFTFLGILFMSGA